MDRREASKECLDLRQRILDIIIEYLGKDREVWDLHKMVDVLETSSKLASFSIFNMAAVKLSSSPKKKAATMSDLAKEVDMITGFMVADMSEDLYAMMMETSSTHKSLEREASSDKKSKKPKKKTDPDRGYH